MALNRVILFGRLVRDPEIRQTASGIPVAKISVACDRQFANKQTGERECDFIEVHAWRQTADFISKYFHKGDAITVEGSLRNNNYEDKSGVKHYSYVVMADNAGFGGSKQQPAQGGYNAPYAPQAPQQVQTYQQQAMSQQNAQRYAQTEPAQQQNLSIGDIGQFEEILSDGPLPF
jgi:single-strand DNA-binding protein